MEFMAWSPSEKAARLRLLSGLSGPAGHTALFAGRPVPEDGTTANARHRNASGAVVLQLCAMALFQRPICGFVRRRRSLLEDRTQIPGARHLGYSRGEQIVAYMQGSPHWRGIYDDYERLMVAISLNIDMGDAWEHADDPYYPVPMTGLAYQLGVNYVIDAMTH